MEVTMSSKRLTALGMNRMVQNMRMSIQTNRQKKEASRIVIERIGAIGGQNDTRWKDKPALSDVTDFNLPTGSEVLIGFRAKSPKGIKSLTISGADNLKGKTVETYGRNSNNDQNDIRD
ncbi:hypothetical protein AK86_02710 [Streptococcus pneumoniae B1599]|nr:hypothetical protein AK86_02710 [Streptococcus pneumoniae B1599]